jgi:signal transduction histidine kinase
MRARSLAWRVLVVLLAAGLVGTLGALVVADRTVRAAYVNQVAPLVAARFTEDEARACERAPERWTMSVWPARGISGYAYDAEHRRSPNPDAPAFDAALATRLGAKPRDTAISLHPVARRGALAVRTAAAPPCDIIYIEWQNGGLGSRVAVAMGASAVASALFSSWLGFMTIVFPLVRRIRRLHAATAHVGEAEGYKGIGNRENGDELDGLALVLDRAHARIRHNAALLEEQRNALERHLAHVAHDLRTPLTSLQVTLEYVADLVAPGAAREAVAAALKDTVYLDGLTQNLGLASRLRSGWSPTDEEADVNLSDIVMRIAMRARMLAKRRDITLDVSIPDEPVVIVCNAVAVEQAIANIVDNAVAYGDPCGHVAVLLTTQRSQDDRTVFAIEVRDDGPGVPPAQLPTLGHITFRSDDARQKEPRGSGLGLAITSEICMRMNWSLAFEALEPRGLCVRIVGTTQHLPQA